MKSDCGFPSVERDAPFEGGRPFEPAKAGLPESGSAVVLGSDASTLALLEDMGIGGAWTIVSDEERVDWNRPIDLLAIAGGKDYGELRALLSGRLPSVAERGLVVVGDCGVSREALAAVADSVHFSHYQSLGFNRGALVLRKLGSARKMYLCGGMQSSGSTLVSMCFLQRDDMDGVYDMDNALIQQDFSRVTTGNVWVKMTIGAFGLAEVAGFYRAQGWDVRPMMVSRDPAAVILSLSSKDYGFDGTTADEPPLFIRLRRYLRDLSDARRHSWPILGYEDLCRSPEDELASTCDALGLAWEPAMCSWPKQPAEFAYPSVGSPSLRASLKDGASLSQAIARYKPKADDAPHRQGAANAAAIVASALSCADGTQDGDSLPLSRFHGSKRQRQEAQIAEMSDSISRISRHALLGPLIRGWRRVVNPGFPDLNPKS